MLIIKLLRYITGYISFRAFGGFADRFLNLCAKDGIPLWNVRNHQGRITASTTIRGYLSIRRAARLSGMRVMHTEKRGLIFFLKEHKRRAGILAGAAGAAALIFVLSQFVWSVSVVGNTTFEEAQLLKIFEGYGVRVGAVTSKLDLKEIANKAVSDNPRLAWAAVNRKGSVLVIEVREMVEKPKIYDSSTPTNVIASEDGVVLSVDVLYGNAEIKVGSAVTRGDLLISGIIAHRDGSETPVHADGHIKAAVKKRKSIAGGGEFLYSLSEENTFYSLFFFGLDIPVSKKGEGELKSSHKAFLQSGDILFPIGIKTEYTASYLNPIPADSEISDRVLRFKASLWEKELLGVGDIKKSALTPQNTNNGKSYEIYAECEQEIGTLQEIYVEKN